MFFSGPSDGNAYKVLAELRPALRKWIVLQVRQLQRLALSTSMNYSTRGRRPGSGVRFGRAFPLLWHRIGLASVPKKDIKSEAFLPRKTNTWPENGSFLSCSWMSVARPSRPLRMSV